jgi:EAL domain-containing protein (putative c-di-GMP-specific phosphodiesterase class I)
MSPPDQTTPPRDDQQPLLQAGRVRAFDDVDMQETEPVAGEFSGLTLQSAFQPVFSPAHRRAVGYEALVRARGPGNHPVSPAELFALPKNTKEECLLDGVCSSIHLSNFMAQPYQHGWLFINVNPMAVAEGNRYPAFFRDLLVKHQFPPNRVVVEIVENPSRDEAVLAQSIEYYRGLGCLIAIDNFGAGPSNIERIWRYQPEIVKLDRSIIVHAAMNPTARRTFSSVVSLLHQSGCLVLAEGVQTEREALIALESDVDLAQGFYFARPDPHILDPHDYADHFDSLWGWFRSTSSDEREQRQIGVADYVHALDHAASGLERGKPLREACWPFLEMPRCERVYELDWQGVQRGATIKALRVGRPDPRFDPICDGAGADWSRRTYFHAALAQPRRVHVSEPYLSGCTANQCITLSIAVLVDGETRVLCGDLNCPER